MLLIPIRAVCLIINISNQISGEREFGQHSETWPGRPHPDHPVILSRITAELPLILKLIHEGVCRFGNNTTIKNH